MSGPRPSRARSAAARQKCTLRGPWPYFYQNDRLSSSTLLQNGGSASKRLEFASMGTRKVEPVHQIRLANVERIIASLPSMQARKAFLARNKLQGNNIWQLRQPPGTEHWRAIGFNKARAIEQREQLEPMSLDQAPASTILTVAEPVIPYGQSRPKNNVLALQYAIQSFASVLHENRPELAAAVAKDIVETAGTVFSGQGFLSTLVGILQGAPQMSEAAPPSVRQPVVSSTSKRAGAVKK